MHLSTIRIFKSTYISHKQPQYRVQSTRKLQAADCIFPRWSTRRVRALLWRKLEEKQPLHQKDKPLYRFTRTEKTYFEYTLIALSIESPSIEHSVAVSASSLVAVALPSAVIAQAILTAAAAGAHLRVWEKCRYIRR